MPIDAPGQPPPTRKQAREVRLAQELRANLGRRKVLTRARSAAAGEKATIEPISEERVDTTGPKDTET